MKLLYPMTNVKISQGSYGAYSHSNSKAIDLAGKDWTSEPIISPCDGMKIILIDAKYVLAEVSGVIELTNGRIINYVELLFYHETANPGVKVGDVFNLGEPFMKEGTKGRATGNHVHVRTRSKGRTEDFLPEEVFWFKEGYHKLIGNKSKYPIVTMKEDDMSIADATKLIALLKGAYGLTSSKEAQDEIHRLANTLRTASGQTPT